MTTVLSGGSIFDTASRQFLTGDVLIDGADIVDVGTDLSGDDTIELAGKAVVPGLIDTHVHVILSSLDFYATSQDPYSMRFYRAISNLSKTLAAGITTVRDAGGADLGIKLAVERGMIAGPSMKIAIGMLSQTGGHGDGWLPSGGALRVFEGQHPGAPNTVVDGPEEMRKKVRELIRAGADSIKVATSGGVLSPNDDPRHAHFQMDELEALVSEASAAGLYVMAHAQATDGIKNAVQAGIRSIEHGIYLDDEAIEMMLEKGTYLVPTLMAPTGVSKAAAAGARIAESSLRKAAEVIDVHRESFAKAVSAGVNIAMGTDSGVTPHGLNREELGLMVDGGMNAADVLVAATQGSAELLGIGHEVGSIEPGKRADLVVLDSDPLDFERWSIDSVWSAGRLVGA